ncbi:nitronate monooxygenase [Bradyrhizobium sp. 41S5]|uniref:NAD(P)H-dependent flavin oxidoreductase n=1 Tax=Bradyrhizobium sp. 41S5 TaxID=1404443 RepID=UPI00156B4D1C|nr:nitronate monooxygenase [Bradyrhizobium sp. 41S5]UFX43928.1 nitronate monooxygenase [Bradyrhizobium sp. 41S5]
MSGLATSLSRRLGVAHPIFGFAHSVDAVAAVSNAGGIGIYGATRDTPEEIHERLKRLRMLVGDRPFGVDLVLPNGMPPRDDREAIERKLPEAHRRFVAALYPQYQVPPATKAGMRSRFVHSVEMAEQQIAAVLESDVNLFAWGFGAPPAAVAEAKARGKLTVALIGSPRHAKGALDTGIDVLVAQGYDAGAHTGPIGTFSLVPQIVDIAGDVPVVAAGGVATGRHIAAALAMGAEGVWLGTAWLATREHALPPTVLKKLLAARSEDAVICRADSGKTLRQIRSAWSDEWSAPDAPKPLRMPYQDILVGDLLGAIDEHEIEPLVHVPAGQSIGYFDRLTTVVETMQKLVGETEAVLRRLAIGASSGD